MERYIPKYLEYETNFQKKFNEAMARHRDGYWYPSFKNIQEAVIRPNRYVDVLFDYYKAICNRYKNKAFKYDFNVSNLLSKAFESYNIEFSSTGIPNPDATGIEYGECDPRTLKIKIECNQYIKDLFIDDVLFNKFGNTFKNILGHELIHRSQFLITLDSDMRSKIFRTTSTEKNELERYKIYLARPQEIMSYAWQSIEELRFCGKSNKQILEYIKEKTKEKKLSYMFDTYIEVFGEGSKEVKLLYKYIYEYIKGDIKNVMQL